MTSSYLLFIMIAVVWVIAWFTVRKALSPRRYQVFLLVAGAWLSLWLLIYNLFVWGWL
jgi:hypothetical protein